ncbi:GNAT family N-acetyltransferase [Streptomyces sp. SID5770]|uniref:GNAT family N-acetyltransferase n=1 Tax=Streptomyces sp. SID5770 TaxID=2690308 RepID=UPI0031BAC824
MAGRGLRPRAHGRTGRAVRPAGGAWGTGVGRALLSATTGALVAAGFRSAALWVFAGNERARRFYEAAGWRADGAAVREETGGRVLEELRYRKHLLD